MSARALRSLALGAATVAAVASARRCFLHWGSRAGERDIALPGDELVARPDITSTRAISIAAPAEVVWPWIAQLGQGRGGFYSYDRLENLIGCDIHSAERIEPRWQSIAVGDDVKLHPKVALRVARLDAGTALVLQGGIPMGRVAAPYDFSWSFVVGARADGTTRLVVRERYAYTRCWSALLVEPVELCSFIMSRRMLRGIRQRAQR